MRGSIILMEPSNQVVLPDRQCKYFIFPSMQCLKPKKIQVSCAELRVSSQGRIVLLQTGVGSSMVMAREFWMFGMSSAQWKLKPTQLRQLCDAARECGVEMQMTLPDGTTRSDRSWHS